MIAIAVQKESRTEGIVPRPWVPLPRVLRLFWAGSALTLVLTAAVAWLEWRAGWVKGRWDPLQYPNFIDLLEYVPTFRLVHTAAFFRSAEVSSVAYPPFGAAVFGLIYATGHAVRVYLLIAAVWLGGTMWGVRRAMVHAGIRGLTATLFSLTLLVASFPIWRLVPQGNIELFLWIFAALGVWAYLRGKDEAAALLWGLAAAMKLYPVILLVLFVPRWKWRALMVGVVSLVGATVLSLAYLGPSVAMAWRGSVENVFGYQGLRAAQWTIHELAGNHSMFTLVKFAGVLAGVSAAALSKPYYVCGAVMFGAVFFGRVRTMPLVNQLLVVSLFMVMLPPVSYFHTLVHLYAPFLLLVFVAIRAGGSVPGLKAVVMLMLPLFSSFTLFTFPTMFLYAGMLQAVVLAMLFVLAVVFPFEEPVRRLESRDA